jgi:hypothetical protein
MISVLGLLQYSEERGRRFLRNTRTTVHGVTIQKTLLSQHLVFSTWRFSVVYVFNSIEFSELYVYNLPSLTEHFFLFIFPVRYYSRYYSKVNKCGVRVYACTAISINIRTIRKKQERLIDIILVSLVIKFSFPCLVISFSLSFSLNMIFNGYPGIRKVIYEVL